MDIIGLLIIVAVLAVYLCSEVFERIGLQTISDLLCRLGDFILDVTLLSQKN